MGRPRTTQVYRFTGERGKRDSIIVVAQLCPEFTARLVDRWQELEAKIAQPAIPQTLPEALRLAAEAIERNEKLALENKAQAEALAEQAPKVEALDRISAGKDSLTLTQAGIRAGYSAKTADRIGPELLGKTCVAEAISKARKARAKTKIAQIDVQELIDQSARESANKSARLIQEAIEQASDVAAGVIVRHRADIRLQQVFEKSVTRARAHARHVPEPRPTSRPTQHTRGSRSRNAAGW